MRQIAVLMTHAESPMHGSLAVDGCTVHTNCALSVSVLRLPRVVATYAWHAWHSRIDWMTISWRLAPPRTRERDALFPLTDSLTGTALAMAKTQVASPAI